MGYALLDGSDLIYHGVKVFSTELTSQERLYEALDTLRTIVQNLDPNLLAIERAFFRSDSRAVALSELIEGIESWARSKGFRVIGVAPSAVKKFITGDGRADKRDVAERVAHKYPELRAYLVREPQWLRLHHSNMFDAVAVGLLAMNRLNSPLK
jgi:crossover junction endodeoxyribonuclease RuvC